MTTPIFIFSLPRSGSTLLQRILAAHSQIATVSEPWIALPQVYAFRDSGIVTEYRQDWYLTAFEDFVAQLPGGMVSYRQAVASFLSRLYDMASPNQERYFLDKTPRYHLIINELADLFPEAKLVFLWRNPLDVAASIMTSWAGGRWNLPSYEIDLYRGLRNLTTGFEHFKNRAIAIRYEDLVADAVAVRDTVCGYLELPFEPVSESELMQTSFKGRFGDQTGTIKYDSVSPDSVGKWKSCFQNPLRRRWAQRYIHWMGKESLDVMGYDQVSLLAEISALRMSGKQIFADLRRTMPRLNLQPEPPRTKTHNS